MSRDLDSEASHTCTDITVSQVAGDKVFDSDPSRYQFSPPLLALKSKYNFPAQLSVGTIHKFLGLIKYLDF